MNWYIEAMTKYAQFKGRARRCEFWYFMLFHVLILVVLSALTGGDGGGALAGFYSLIAFIPGLAVTVRRLQDVGRSGWWMFVPVAPLVFLLQDGTPGPNEYGDDPKADALQQA